MARSTRSGRAVETLRTAFHSSQSPPRDARRTCSKRKVRYNEDTDDDSDDDSRRKRYRGGSSEGSSDGDVNESPVSSPRSPSPAAPSSTKLSMDFENVLQVSEESAAAKKFRGLAVEIHQNIIRYIKTDRGIAHYAKICRETHNAASTSVWRERCERVFDVVPEEEIVELQGGKQMVIPWPVRAAQLYKIRQIDTSHWISFDPNFCRSLDVSTKELQWTYQYKVLEHLKDLILESNAERVVTVDGNTMIVGKNLEYIRKLTCFPEAVPFVNVLHNILEEDFTVRARGESGSEKEKKAMMVMIQLCLSPIILGRNTCTSAVFHFDYSQKVVYSNSSVPLFKNKYKSQVNIGLVLNTLNFFKFHLKATGEGLMGDAYRRLDEDQLPQMWAGKIPVGTQPLSGHWKGFSVFLDPKELKMLRDKSSDEEIFSDSVEDENLFMDVTFFNDESRFSSKHWPTTWDAFIDSDPYAELDNPLPAPASSKKKKNNTKQAPKPVKRPQIKEFWGTSRGHRTGHMFGRIHSVSTQADFHGWQRVTMLKCFENKGAWDPSQVWVYEGVVLPGGRMILGRWSHPFGNQDTLDSVDSGPFIFWNVDRSTANPPIDKDEAWKFGEQIDDPLFQGLFF